MKALSRQLPPELATRLAPADAGDFGVETIDACADTADQAAARIRSAIEALQTLPFFGGGKLVWLKNANFLGDDKLSRSAAVQEALEALSAALEGDLGGGEVKFLLSAPEVDKRRSFYKALAKRAELQVFDKLDSSREWLGGGRDRSRPVVRRKIPAAIRQGGARSLRPPHRWRHPHDRKRA